MLGPDRFLGKGRVRTARMVAMAADALQLGIFPLFAPGAASPVNDALDVAVAGAMTWLVGWHWAFLPSFVAELVPGLDLVPTWTAAVFFATRGEVGRAPRAGAIDAEVISSEPASPPPPHR
ncbi:MAG: hypothetical protein ABJC61_13620 [Acidobacteriota bacterium]